MFFIYVFTFNCLTYLLFLLQKWSKGKVRDKLDNQVFFDKATYDKLIKDIPSGKLITPSVVSERLKVRGSLARKALEELLKQGNGTLFMISSHYPASIPVTLSLI